MATYVPLAAPYPALPSEPRLRAVPGRARVPAARLRPLSLGSASAPNSSPPPPASSLLRPNASPPLCSSAKWLRASSPPLSAKTSVPRLLVSGLLQGHGPWNSMPTDPGPFICPLRAMTSPCFLQSSLPHSPPLLARFSRRLCV